VVRANGLKVYLSDRECSSPAVSFACRTSGRPSVDGHRSHNPPRFNGLKIKAHYGGSATPEMVAQVEAQLRSLVRSGAAPRVSREPIATTDLAGPYLDHCARFVDLERVRKAGFKSSSIQCMDRARISDRHLAARRCGCHGDPLGAQSGLRGINPNRSPKIWARFSMPCVRKAPMSGSVSMAMPIASAPATARDGSLIATGYLRCCFGISSKSAAGAAAWCGRSRRRAPR